MGSGNVFRDLGVPDADTEHLKVDLSVRIKQSIKGQGLDQTRAARLMGVHQSDVSDVVRLQLDGYSIDRLLRMLGALGHDVEIIVRPRPAHRRRRPIRIMDEYPAPRARRAPPKPARKKRPAR